MNFWPVALWFLVGLAGPRNAGADAVGMVFQPLPHAKFHLEGVVGRRALANTENWLLSAPKANPGMLEMFQVRDRLPKPELVPWAGEFVGKYLISAIQALRMGERPELRATVSRTVADLIASQAEDGYLGPFPREVRLKGNWDLWGHYHCMLALLMWHEATGDPVALRACQRAGDLVCATFLSGSMRVYDVGSHEMNMAIIHGLGRLYRVTHEARYLAMMREIEKDWERAGDYFRTGLNGLEYFQTPRPRWESLHDVQGLVELFRITGDARYRAAFEHHWRSILRWDRRNTGGFSSGEQATGNPYAPTAIETCCTIAWMAVTLDMLQLTGEARAADEFELSLYNGALGAQHPSGRWCTYNTPMDGVREASAHTIVFQSRAGTPELNCCSVNGPRGLGMASEWAVMSAVDGLVVNYYGPGMFQGKLSDNTPVALTWQSEYPLSGAVTVRVEPLASRRFRLLLRIPAWSRDTAVEVNGNAVARVTPGQYLELNRRWEPGDRVTLHFDLRLRAVPGDREAAGKVSVYRGPLLLCYDQGNNSFDENAIPLLDLGRLSEAREVVARLPQETDSLAPWLLVELPAAGTNVVRVCDYASAGARGTRYRSWLPVAKPLPPPVVTRTPGDATAVPAGSTMFRWTGPRQTGDQVREYQLTAYASDQPDQPVIQLGGLKENRILVDQASLARLSPGKRYAWRVLAINANGLTRSVEPDATFTIDPALPRTVVPAAGATTPTDRLVSASLRGKPDPEAGTLHVARGVAPAAGLKDEPGAALETDGREGMLTYTFEEFPDEDYAVAVWVNLKQLPSRKVGQLVSLWSGSMDDPLRLCVAGGKLFARIEAGQGYSTPGVTLESGQWRHLVAVKTGADLRLYVDGVHRGSAAVPLYIHSQSTELGVGGNPRYSGDEFLAARFCDLRFYNRALSEPEIKELAERGSKGALP